MRVLHVFKTYWPDTFGGIERTIDAIARGAMPHGIESAVLTVSPRAEPGTIRFNGHDVHRARLTFDIASTALSATLPRQLALRAAEADLVHYHFPWPMMDLAHVIARHRKPSLVTYHSDIVRQRALMPLYRPLMNRFLAGMDRIVATSPAYARSSPVLEAHRDRVSVVPIGLEEMAYPKADPERLAHWRARLPAVFVLAVGVLRYYKSFDLLIAAARKSGVPVVVAGKGPMAETLRHAAGADEGRIVFLPGAIDEADKIALLTLARAVALPSSLRSEAFGLILVEAAMFARPMITCEIGTGTSYVNRDGETGLVVPPHDADRLAEALARLAADPALARAMGERARARFEALFTAERMARSYVDLYGEVLSGAPIERSAS